MTEAVKPPGPLPFKLPPLSNPFFFQLMPTVGAGIGIGCGVGIGFGKQVPFCKPQFWSPCILVKDLGTKALRLCFQDSPCQMGC